MTSSRQLVVYLPIPAQSVRTLGVIGGGQEVHPRPDHQWWRRVQRSLKTFLFRDIYQ